MTLKLFNPDLSVGDHSNGERADRAEKTLDFYQHMLGEAGPHSEERVRDLLSDLLHYMHREGWPEARLFPLSDMTKSAHDNFVEETNGEDETTESIT